MLHEKSVILHRCIHYVYTCVYYMLMIVNVYCTEVLSTGHWTYQDLQFRGAWPIAPIFTGTFSQSVWDALTAML